MAGTIRHHPTMNYLYLWNNVLSGEYTDGTAFVIASSIEEAVDILVKQMEDDIRRTEARSKMHNVLKDYAKASGKECSTISDWEEFYGDTLPPIKTRGHMGTWPEHFPSEDKVSAFRKELFDNIPKIITLADKQGSAHYFGGAD